MTASLARVEPAKSIATLAAEYGAVREATRAFAPVPAPATGYDYSALGLAYHPLKQRNHLAVLINRALRRPLVPTTPIEVQLNNIGFCNLRCPHCPTHGTDDVHAEYQSKTYTMSLATVEKIAQETFPATVKVSTSGIGEGLLYKDFGAIIANATRYGVHIFTNTNGTTLIPKLVGGLFGITELRLSLDGATPAAFEAVRLGAQYNRVMRNVLVLKHANARLPPTLRLRPTVNFGICASNIRDVPLMVDLCAHLGLDGLYGSRLVPLNPKYEHDDIYKYPAYYKYYYLQAMQRAEARTMAVKLPDPAPDVEPDPDAGPQGVEMIVSGVDDNYYRRLPSFDRLIDETDLEPEIETLMRAALEAGIARHSAAKPSAVREAAEHARQLDAQLWESIQRGFASLPESERARLAEMHRSDRMVHDCFFLQAHLIYYANGVVRGCCDPVIDPIGNASMTANQLLASPTLMTIVDEFRRGQLRKECQGCSMRQQVPERAIFPVKLG